MKRSILLFISLILLLSAHSQVIETRNGMKCVTTVTPLKKGKYAISRSVTRNTEAAWSGNQSSMPPGFSLNPDPKRNPDASVPTYHVIFHMDFPGFSFFCTNADTIFMPQLNMTWTNNGLEADMPEGNYYLFAEFQRYTPTKDSLFYVFQNNFRVYKDMDTTILHTSARNTVKLSLYDKNGVELQNKHQAGDSFGLLFEFPDSCFSNSFSLAYSGYAVPDLKFSDVSPEIKLVMGKSNVPLTRPYHDYIVQYPTLNGLAGDTAMAFEPSEYRHFTFCHHPTPAFDTAFYNWGYGTIGNDSLIGFQDTFVVTWITRQYPGCGTDSSYVYMAGIPDNSLKQNIAALVGHSDKDPLDYIFCDFIGPVFYLNQGNELVMTCFGNYPSVEGDYRVPNGSKVDFGVSAPFHFSYNYNFPGQHTIDVYQHFRDQTGARRDIDLSQATYDIWQGDVMVYHDSVRQFHIYYWTPGPDVYSLVVHDSNYTLLGKQGYLRSKMTMDLGFSDPNPPSLIAFKVLMGDSIRPELIHGFPASVEFVAGDYDQLPPDYIRTYHSLSGAFLSYKEYQDSVWSELEVIQNSSGLDSLGGMPYRADLQPVLDQFPDSAWIDLMVTVVDSSGNFTTQTMHPAFLVRDAMVGEPSVNSSLPVCVFPNPANDKLHISATGEWTDIVILSSTGQKMMDIPFSPEIEVSSLHQGLYLMQLRNSRNGKAVSLKFVKM